MSGRELRATERQAERAGGRVREQGLRDSGHALEQDVAAGEERGQQAPDDLVLAEDDLRRPRRERDPRSPSTPPPRSPLEARRDPSELDHLLRRAHLALEHGPLRLRSWQPVRRGERPLA